MVYAMKHAWAGWDTTFATGGSTVTLDDATGVLNVYGPAATGPRRGLYVPAMPGDVFHGEVIARTKKGKGYFFANWNSGQNLVSVEILGSEFTKWRFTVSIPIHYQPDFIQFFVGCYAGANVESEAEFFAPKVWRNGLPVQAMPGLPVRVHKNGTAQTLTSGLLTKLTWSTAAFDLEGQFNATDSIVTPTVKGYYAYRLRVTFDLLGGAVDNSYAEARVTFGPDVSVLAVTAHRVAGTGSFTLEASGERFMSGGSTNYFECWAQQNGGAARDVLGAQQYTSFSCWRIG